VTLYLELLEIFLCLSIINKSYDYSDQIFIVSELLFMLQICYSKTQTKDTFFIFGL
jgi:hypothetical protein